MQCWLDPEREDPRPLQKCQPINAIGRAEAGRASSEDNSVVVDVTSLHGKMGYLGKNSHCDGWGSHNVNFVH